MLGSRYALEFMHTLCVRAQRLCLQLILRGRLASTPMHIWMESRSNDMC